MATKSSPIVTPKKLPDAEIQALADQALKVWDTGLDAEAEDTLGGAWLFRVRRNERAGLELIRCVGIDEDDEARVDRRTGFVGGEEFGAHDHIRGMMASRILALASAP